jgi:hypothetical protein
MSIIVSLIVFVILVIVLSGLRTRLVYELSGTSLLIFGTTKPGLIFYTILFLPGTIIHELSHWIVAEVLQVRTGTIEILPDFKEQGSGQQRLGSVATAHSDPLRGFLIGAAPFVTGIAILIVLGRLLSIGLATNLLWWQLALIIYGIMVIGNSMMISESDRRTWPFIIIFILLIIIIISRYYPSIFTSNQMLFLDILNPTNQVLGVTAGLNLVMIGGSYALRRFVQIITKKRIMHK